ncbi:hypothetical protein L2E82_28678 [Cichorium intybus]|uniref:Uncharacterized protein n=1 Tax=Cichorium intybus TaxID=13427 RepID=A0ACB9CWU0_CICIN|nr:hypothetical protein L2E82_28678 [Cichorium intybus]
MAGFFNWIVALRPTPPSPKKTSPPILTAQIITSYRSALSESLFLGHRFSISALREYLDFISVQLDVTSLSNYAPSRLISSFFFRRTYRVTILSINVSDNYLLSSDCISIRILRVSRSVNFQTSFCRFASESGVESGMMVAEAPFRAREHLLEKQKLFQSIHKHTHLKSPMDKVTSVAIPLALAGSCLFLIGRGIYNMSHGIGKKE